MKNSSSFRGFFAIYFVALIFCLAARIYFKLAAMDPITGFYQGAGGLVSAFNAVLAVCVVLLYLLYLLRKTDGDYPVVRQDRPVAFFALLCGLAMTLYQLEMLGIPVFGGFGALNLGVQLDGIALMLSVAFGWLSSLVFIFIGGRALFVYKGQLRGGLLCLFAAVWMLITLVASFNRYTTLTTISDNLLAVLFMVFVTLFFTGHARTLGGFARKDGRNYSIPSGLSASLCGILLVLPNWIWMAVNGTLSLPAPMLGSFESVFIFTASIYAFLFVRHTCLGIRSV